MRTPLLCALLCGALAVACGRGVDTKKNVRNALDQANIENVDVDVDRMRSADEKNRVGQMVAAAPGVKDVANGLEIRNSH